MEECLNLTVVLQTLGFEDYRTRGTVLPMEVTSTRFFRWPPRTARLGAALAAKFWDERVDAVVGLGPDDALLANAVALSLCQYPGSCNVALARLSMHPTEDGKIGIGPEDLPHVKEKRVLVVSLEASRVILLAQKASVFCRECGADWISVGLIANHGCDPASLGVDQKSGEKVRSIIDCPPG